MYLPVEGVVLAVGWRRSGRRYRAKAMSSICGAIRMASGLRNTERLDVDAIIGIAQEDVTKLLRTVFPNVAVARP